MIRSPLVNTAWERWRLGSAPHGTRNQAKNLGPKSRIFTRAKPGFLDKDQDPGPGFRVCVPARAASAMMDTRGGRGKVGVPLELQGGHVFVLFSAMAIAWSFLLRTMSVESCGMLLFLVAIPLYSVVVRGVPFSLEVVLSFGGDGGAVATALPAASSPRQPQPVARAPVFDGPAAPTPAPSDPNPPSSTDGKAAPAEAVPSAPSSALTQDKYFVPTNTRVKPFFSFGSDAKTLFRSIPATSFKVRCGPDYPRNKFKNASKSAMYDFLGFDGCRTRGVCPHVARYIDISQFFPDGKIQDIDIDGTSVPRLLVQTWQFTITGSEGSGGGWLGSNKKESKDGAPSATLVLYYTLSKAGEKAIRNREPAANLWLRYCRGEINHHRYKPIFRIANRDDLGLGMLARRAFDQLDGKPFLAGPHKKTGTYYRGKGYIEIDAFVQNYSFMPRTMLARYQGMLSRLEFQTAFVIQAETEDEMPERVVGASSFGPNLHLETLQKVNWTGQIY